MENKRDAASAGLAWPVTSNRGTHSTVVPNATTGDASSTNPSSTPSASLEPMIATIGTAAGAPLETYSASPHPAAPFPTYDPPHVGAHRHSRYTERVVHQIHFKIFTHSNNESSYLLKKCPRRESPNVEILNISSTDFQAIGNGLHKLLTIGATTLKFLSYMGTTLFATWLLTQHYLLKQRVL
jgi:hypothetical protein